MRIICLKLKAHPKKRWLERLTAITPRIAVREDKPLVFLDVSTTAPVWGSFERCLDELEEILISTGFTDFEFAAGSQPWTAQAHVLLFGHRPEERQAHELPLAALMHFEGLVPWPRKKEIAEVIRVLQQTGFQVLSDLQRLSFNHFKNRWGKLGEYLWKRLNDKDKQVVSFFPTSTPWHRYQYFEPSLGHTQGILMWCEQEIKKLVTGLQKEALSLRELHLHMIFEYSQKTAWVRVSPVTATRDSTLLMTLLRHRIEEHDYQNPVRELQITALTQKEVQHQLGFFDTLDPSEAAWPRLLNSLHDRGIRCGFLQKQPRLLPEQQWEVVTDRDRKLSHMSDSEMGQHSSSQLLENQKDKSGKKTAATETKPLPVYSSSLSMAPRPNLILTTPEPFSPPAQAQAMRRTERLTSHWWTGSPQRRDYWIVKDPRTQALSWVYLDLASQEYWLHGHFD